MQYIPQAQQHGQCLEIGCHPGRYLTVFGDLGYTINGIDFASDLNLMGVLLKDQGYSVGDLIKDDFLNHVFLSKYDVVASFGFIEHFVDWQEIIVRHLNLVTPGGFAVLQVPNFIGTFQRHIHSKYDAANMTRHVLDAMYINDWLPLLEQESFEVIFSGYFGGFSFWIDDVENLNYFQRIVYNAYLKIKAPLARVCPNSVAYSPLAGIVARKTSEPFAN